MRTWGHSLKSRSRLWAILILVLWGCDPGPGPAADAVLDAVPDAHPDTVAPPADAAPEIRPSPEDTAAPEVAPDLFDWPDPRPRTTLAEGFHVPPEFPEAGAPFSVIMASDPQLWWNFVDGDEGFTDPEIEQFNQLHIDAMNALIAGEQLPPDATPPVAVVMNGDLTEYGRWDQWDAYYRLYEGVQAPIFDGLGNHEYENNNTYVSDGCAMNAEDLEAWMQACEDGNPTTLWGEDACTIQQNFKELWGWCANDAMRRMRFWLETHAGHLYDYDPGSASYSWEIGDVHFVQLHGHPGYEVPETEICSGIPWLKHDLKDAFERGRKIVLAMHKPISSAMTEHLAGYQYNIVGIFFGHIHEKVGYTGDFVLEGVPIPRFYSGSVQWNIFSLAQFEADRLIVTAIDSNTGIPVHAETSDGYGNLNGAYAAAPFTYVYPTHDCPAGQIPETPGGPCMVPALDTPTVELCY